MQAIKNNLRILVLLIFFMAFVSFQLVYNDKTVSDLKIFKNKTELEKCGRFPEEKDIFTDNSIWQVMQHPKGFVKILNAYLDTRPDKRRNSTVVRLNVISVMLNDTEEDVVYCQFWFDGKAEAAVVKATEIWLMWRNLNKFSNFNKI